MTNAELLARCRVFLDESTAGFYTDAEIYVALTEAQLEVVSTLAINWWSVNRNKGMTAIPKAITPLITQVGASLGAGIESITVADLLVPISLAWNAVDATSVFPLYRTVVWPSEAQRSLLANHPIFADGYYAYVSPTGIQVSKATATFGLYNLFYIKKPTTNISSVNQPIADTVAHDTICERALWILLKDRETEQANLHLQIYGTLLQGLSK